MVGYILIKVDDSNDYFNEVFSNDYFNLQKFKFYY